MSTIYLNGVDLEAELDGVLVTELPDFLHRLPVDVGSLVVPGVAGVLPTGPAVVPAREFSIGVWVDGQTVEGNRDRLDALAALIGATVIPVESIDLGGTVIFARLLEARPVPVQPALVTPWTNGELVFRAEDPYWREAWAQWIGFGTGFVALPVWNAPTAPVYEIWGPVTDWVDLVQADPDGTPRRTSRFNITLNTDQDFVRIYTEAFGMSIWKSIAGTLTQDDTLLDVDSLFPQHLEAPGGAAYLRHYPMVKLAAGGGTPRGKACYPRQALNPRRAP